MPCPDSPKSYASRMSTPVSDLDDHRHQPEHLPRADTMGSVERPTGRRGTFSSTAAPEPQPQPDRLTVNVNMGQEGMTSRDFEESAVIDDDRSGHGSFVEGRKYFRRESNASPTVGRRGTFKRNHDQHNEPPKSPRPVSVASVRSVSPPNSVDAFAGPRRRDRAGTINSNNASTVDLALHRTASNGTHPASRRRGTFGSVKVDGFPDFNDTASRRSSAEDDVCFPVEDDHKNDLDIDFADLEEFVAQYQSKTPVMHPLKYKQSNISKTSQYRVFHDLRPQIPQIRTQAPSSNGDAGTPMHEKDSELDEKHVDVMAETKKVADTIVEPLNRWTFFSSEMDDTVHAAELGGLLMPGETFQDLFQLAPDGGMWWLDMLNPTEEEVFAICKAFGVHPLTREDILEQETREKVELFKRYYFVCFRSFFQLDKESEDFLEPVNIYLVVFRDGLLSFSFCPNPHAANVRKRIARLRDYLSLSADWVCYAMIDDIVDNFGPPIREIEQQTDNIEDQVFITRLEDSRVILKQIGDCRKRVMSLLRLLGGKADVIKGFAKRCNEEYSVAPRGDVGLYLSDIQDHVVTMASNLSHFEKMLSRSHSNYLAQISVDNIAEGNRMNEMLGKVTLIATILVPLNLICGLFGMNVPIPFQQTDDFTSLGPFFGILGIIFLVVIVFLGCAKKMKYI